MKLGADLQSQVGDGLMAIHLAASRGCRLTVQALVLLGADVDARCGERSTALIWAAGRGHLPTVLINVLVVINCLGILSLLEGAHASSERVTGA